jgi:ribosomal-protein-alanine N-acetyltransferase
MPVTIRHAVLDDITPIMAIEQEATSAAHWTREQYERRVTQGLILVVTEAERIVGFICARDAAGEWEIENVVVIERGRRRGLALNLVNEFLRHVRQHDVAVVRLEVRETNQAGRRLYEKAGFYESGRRRAYYSNPIEDALLYELRVGASKPLIGAQADDLKG